MEDKPLSNLLVNNGSNYKNIHTVFPEIFNEFKLLLLQPKLCLRKMKNFCDMQTRTVEWQEALCNVNVCTGHVQILTRLSNMFECAKRERHV
jgi:hypothetical protein